MRWIWIDKFLEFESGRRARAQKNLSLAEEHLHDHFPGFPMMPNSLIVEGLAQTGGILVGEYNAFALNVVLAKVSKARFHLPALPGDTLEYTAEVDYIKPEGAMVNATSRLVDPLRGTRLQAEAEIVFAHVDDAAALALFGGTRFVFSLELLSVFDVGRGRAGEGLADPPGLIKFRAAQTAAGS